jgi:hypothetical protein
VGTNEWTKTNLGFGGIDTPQTLGEWFPYFHDNSTVAQIASLLLFLALALIVARMGQRKVE